MDDKLNLYRLNDDSVWEKQKVKEVYRVGGNFIYQFINKNGRLVSVSTKSDGEITDVSVE